VATALGVSKIVHVGGGVPCGAYPDLKIARLCLLPKIGEEGRENERAAADKGYRDKENTFITPLKNNRGSHRIDLHNSFINDIKSRHETVNKRLKDFGVLRQMYRGGWKEHTIIFRAICIITQIKMKREPLYDVTVRLGDLVLGY
jgi:hypothetical protein